MDFNAVHGLAHASLCDLIVYYPPSITMYQMHGPSYFSLNMPSSFSPWDPALAISSPWKAPP